MFHVFFFLHIKKIDMNAVVVLTVATRHKIVQVLLDPSVKDVVIGFKVVVDVVSSCSRSSKGGCRCFFFVFFLLL